MFSEFIYVFILSLIVIGIIFYDIGKSERNKNKYFNIVYVLMAIVAIFRYGVSPDTMNYMTAYEYIPPLESITWDSFLRFRFDILYTLTNSIVKSIFDSFLGVQIIHGLLVYVSFYKLIKFLHADKFFVLLYFYLQYYLVFGMGELRQGMAAGLVFFAIPFLLQRKYKYYFVLSILAILFHASAVITLLFPLLNKIKNVNCRILLFIAALIPLIFPLISISLGNLASLTGGSLANYSNRYIDNINFTFSILNYGKNLLFIYLLFIVPSKYQKLSIVHWLGFIYICIDMGSESIPIFFRFKDYLFPFYVSLFCEFLHRYRIRKVGLISIFSVILFFYQPYMVYQNMFSKELRGYFIPYASYLSEKNQNHYNALKNDFVRDYMNW